MNNDLIEYKLNILQKIRLELSKRFVTLSSYVQYPDYLAQNEQIIEQLLEKYGGRTILQNEDISLEIKKTIISFLDKEEVINFAKEGILDKDIIQYLHETEGYSELIPYLDENYILESYRDGKIKTEELSGLQKKSDSFKAKLIYIDALSKEINPEIMDILRIENPNIQFKLYQELKRNRALPQNFFDHYPEIIGKIKDEEIQELAFSGKLYKIIENMNYSEIVNLNIPESVLLESLSREKYHNIENYNYDELEILIRIKKIEECIEQYPDIGFVKEIIKEIQTSFVKGRRGEVRTYYLEEKCKEIRNIEKIVTNAKIMEVMNSEQVKTFINDILNDPENPKNYETICNIVEKIYGEEAVNILRERPELTIEDISNFDIFDERIRQVIGYGGVHTFLTYYMDSEYVISEMVKNPELINEYEEFKKMTGEYFPNSAIGLEDRLISFYKNRNLMSEIIKTGSQDRLKDLLLLSIRDKEFFNYMVRPLSDMYEKIETELSITDFGELEEYNIKRNQILNEYIDNPDLDLKELRELLLLKYFGNIKNTRGEYMEYDHKKFLTDYLKFNSSEFSEDEVDLIELYSIIQDTTDSNTLRKINELLRNQEQTINPVHMKSIDAKVVESYKREYMNTVLNLEKIKSMVADPENQSSRYVIKEDGTEIHTEYIRQPDGTLVYNYNFSDGQIIKKSIQKDKVQYCTDIMKMELHNNSDYTFYNGDTSFCRKRSNNNQYQYTFEKKNEDGTITFYIFDNELLRMNTKNKDGEIICEEKISLVGNDDFQYQMTRNVEGGKETYYYDSRQPEKPRAFLDREEKREDLQRDWIKWETPTKQKKLFEQLKKYKDEIEQYIEQVVSKTEQGTIISPLEQLCKSSDILQEGDTEVFEVYGVDKSSLFFSSIRGSTSKNLNKKRIVKRVLDSKGEDFEGTDEDIIYIQQNLEGGIPSISHYYNTGTNNWAVSLAYTNIDPNAIIGYCTSDAGTYSEFKKLKIKMECDGATISTILDDLKKLGGSGEIATLRYQYDISQILPRNRWRKN